MSPEKKLRRQKGMSLGYWVTKLVCGIVFGLGFRVKILGVENLPPRGAFLLAANHTSYFDPPLISSSIPNPLYFFARKSLLKNWWFHLLYQDLNVIPVETDGNDVGAVRQAIARLKDGFPLVVFPEGTRSPDGTLQRGKAGSGLIACKAGVPVVPVRIFGAYEALDRMNRKPKWGMPMTLVIGKVLPLADYDPGEGVKDRYQIAIDRVMAAIAAIEKPREHIEKEFDWRV